MCYTWCTVRLGGSVYLVCIESLFKALNLNLKSDNYKEFRLELYLISIDLIIYPHIEQALKGVQSFEFKLLK